MTERVLRAYYDLNVAPPSFDICVFLYVAEMERLYRGLDAIDLVVVGRSGGGLRHEYHPSDEADWRLHHLVLPAHRLIPSCRRALYYPDRHDALKDFDAAIPIFPTEYTVERPVYRFLDSEILTASFSGKPYATLRAPAAALKRVKEWMRGYVGDRKAVTISLRNETFQPSRNSNLNAWIAFADSLDPSVFQPVFVRDTLALFRPAEISLERFLLFDSAALDIELRLALYELAHVNLFVDSGPAVCCMLDDLTRCIRFKLKQDGNLHAGTASFHRRGYSERMQWAATNSHQISVWSEDTADCISREFFALHEQLRHCESPVRRPLPPTSIVASNFIVGGNFRDAITITSIAIDREPDNLELRYLRATALMNSGERILALKEFQRLFELPQARAAIVIPFATCLWQTGQVKSAAELLIEAAKQQPEAGLLRSIGQLLLDMGEERAGTEIVNRTMELIPDDPTLLHAYARYLAQSNLTTADAIEMLKKAIRLQPDSPSLHSELADCYARQAAYEHAVRHKLNSVSLQGIGSFTDYLDVGSWSKYLSNEFQAETNLQKASAIAENQLDLNVVPVNKSIEWLAKKSRIALIRGCKDSARACYDEILKRFGAGSLRYSPAFYLPRTPERIDRLCQIVGGRDVFILCHGPSIAALNEQWKYFVRANACLMAVNRFYLFEGGFLSFTKSIIDVVAVTHYRLLQHNFDDIAGFLSRDSKNLLITLRWAMERLGRACPSRQKLEATFDEKLLYFGGVSDVTPATPYDPLRFLFGNTLSILVTMAAIGRARRVFLFGADGSVPENSGKMTHYGADDARFDCAVVRSSPDRIKRALAADSTIFSHITEIGLIATECLFGMERPPIYNVSPESAIDLFPRITYKEAAEILKIAPNEHGALQARSEYTA